MLTLLLSLSSSWAVLAVAVLVVLAFLCYRLRLKGRERGSVSTKAELNSSSSSSPSANLKAVELNELQAQKKIKSATTNGIMTRNQSRGEKGDDDDDFEDGAGNQLRATNMGAGQGFGLNSLSAAHQSHHGRICGPPQTSSQVRDLRANFQQFSVNAKLVPK